MSCFSNWNYIFLFNKTTYLNEEVNSTSPLVRFTWSRLLQIFINYRRKKFYNNFPWCWISVGAQVVIERPPMVDVIKPFSSFLTLRRNKLECLSLQVVSANSKMFRKCSRTLRVEWNNKKARWTMHDNNLQCKHASLFYGIHVTDENIMIIKTVACTVNVLRS